MTQGWVGLGRMTKNILKKYINSEKNETCYQFQLKILNDIVKVRGFSTNILTLARKELSENSTSAYLVSVNSQHNNYDGVTI